MTTDAGSEDEGLAARIEALLNADAISAAYDDDLIAGRAYRDAINTVLALLRSGAAQTDRSEGLREAVKAAVRSMDEWLESSSDWSHDDRRAIRTWSRALRAALAGEGR